MRLLVIEDSVKMASLLRRGLTEEGYAVDVAANGTDGVWLATEVEFDAIVLDIGLPDIDGFEVCRRVRAHSALPVLFLSARDGEIDRVLGLELGADDYVTKPFSPREVVARVRAILRRGLPAPTPDATQVEIGEGMLIDTARREVTVGGEPVPLATKEFDLLAFLARNLGLALTRQQLLDGVWGIDWIGDDRTVDVHVRQLRKKLGDALPLATVWGVGYRLG